MDRTAWDRVFALRFKRREDELKWLYCGLYHRDMPAYERFVDGLHRAYVQRPRALRALDAERAADPDWYRGGELVGMQLYVQAFAGTLNGLRQRLDYIQACGVNCLRLMPLLESSAGRSDGGYAVSDFRRVQPELGTMEDLAALAADCRARNMILCLDFPMNHTSEDHEWARRARAGDPAYQYRYFFYDNWEIPNAFDKTMPQVFPVTAPGDFTWCPEAGKVVMTTFHPYQWDLNYANPDVFNDMTENLLYLCNQGLDAIRLDAMPYIWKSLGSSCRNMPQTHTLARLLRLACEIVCPGALLLGGVGQESGQTETYFGGQERPECHLMPNVAAAATLWHTVAAQDVRLLRHQLGRMFAQPKRRIFLNYLRCHDDIGWDLDYGFLNCRDAREAAHKKFLNDYFTGKSQGSTARGELFNADPQGENARLCGTAASLCGVEAALESGDPEALERALRMDVMLHALVFTLSGVPVLYGGDELARLNDAGYRDDPLKAGDSRWLHRGSMDWDKAERRADPAAPEGRMFAAVRRLASLRRAHALFGSKADVWLLDTNNDQVLGIGRYLNGQKLLALFNFSGEPQTIRMGDPERYRDLWTDQPRNADVTTLPAWDFAWLLRV